jgi:hypothetical protein
MAKQNINTGTSANSKNGDPLRTAFTKINANFTELYTLTGGTAPVVTVIAAVPGGQIITDNASAAFIQFNETVDTANAYSDSTFTAPYTGYYQINLTVRFTATVVLIPGSFLLIDTNLDNTKQVSIINGNWTGSYVSYSTVIPATVGDSIRVAFRQVSGADITIASGRLTIHRVSIS